MSAFAASRYVNVTLADSKATQAGQLKNWSGNAVQTKTKTEPIIDTCLHFNSQQNSRNVRYELVLQQNG